jgi:uncharacterized protein with PIN domain
MSEIKFYLDENISPRIASTLRMDGIDVVSAHDLQVLGDSDENHLHRATTMGRVLCTQDRDYLELDRADKSHAGIAFAEQDKANFDLWVKYLSALHESRTAEMMQGIVFTLPTE